MAIRGFRPVEGRVEGKVQLNTRGRLVAKFVDIDYPRNGARYCSLHE